jgi:hypothetical protein
VLVEQIDRINPQPPQRLLGYLPDARGAAVGRAGPSGAQIEAKFGSDDNVLPERLERFADQLFVGEGAVDLSGVEEGDPTRYGCPDQGDHLAFVRGRAAVIIHPHTAQADRRNFQAFAECALSHNRFSPPVFSVPQFQGTPKSRF